MTDDADRIVAADWCGCGVFLPDVTDGIAHHRLDCERFPTPKRYTVRSDRVEMYEDADGNWVSWHDYLHLRASKLSLAAARSSSRESGATDAAAAKLVLDAKDAEIDRLSTALRETDMAMRVATAGNLSGASETAALHDVIAAKDAEIARLRETLEYIASGPASRAAIRFSAKEIRAPTTGAVLDEIRHLRKTARVALASVPQKENQ